MVTLTRVDNEETMLWLERSLELVRSRTQERLTGLLEAVQLELAFEMELPEVEMRHRTPARPEYLDTRR